MSLWRRMLGLSQEEKVFVPTEPCPVCHGIGDHYTLHLGKATEEPCGHCGGTGRVEL